jgi:LysM repeat protein
MRRSGASSRRRRPTAVVLGVLVAFVVTTIALFVFDLTGNDTGTRVQSRLAHAAAPTAAPTTTTTLRPKVDYQVKRGDSLTTIAFWFGVTTTAILHANRIENPDQLVEGQVLVIPPPPRLELLIEPGKIRLGESVTLTLEGAHPSETVTFQIALPNGTFTGPPHSASPEGTVTTSYQPLLEDPPGTYTVTATGTRSTTARATFVVRPASP